MHFSHICLQSVRGVIIDIDDTLYHYHPPHKIAIRTCYDALKNTYTVFKDFEDFYAQYRHYRTAVIHALQGQGACRSRLFAFQHLFEQHNISQAYVVAKKYENLYWDTLIDAIQLDDEALQFLRICHKKNIIVCALTDMQAGFQVRKLVKMKVEKYIALLVSSEEVGVEKPHSKMFQTALKKMGLSAQDVIMIGDRQSKDIVGAENLQIKAYKITLSNDIIYYDTTRS